MFSGLAGSGDAVAGSLTLLALLAVHASFVLGVLLGGDGRWWIFGAQVWLTYLPLPLFGAAWTPVCGLLAERAAAADRPDQVAGPGGARAGVRPGAARVPGRGRPGLGRRRAERSGCWST
ncbi:hypothetical protein ACFSTC_17635 [Nonomuraea ferruginea]